MVDLDSQEKSVLMVAAEASSCHYALKILQAWKSEGLKVKAFGVGSLEMEKEGFERLGKSEEMSVVGFSEVLSEYSKLKAVFNKLVEEAQKRRPRVVVVMDYPGFNLRLAKKLHALGLKVVYYISPQVWAWKKNRIHTIKRYCDKVLLLFPFEVPFYQKHQVPYEFVGHPLLDDFDDMFLDPDYRKQQRSRFGIQPHDRVLGLMPGSRKGELKNIFPQQLRVAARLMRQHPDLRLAILAAPTVDRDHLLCYMEDFRFPFQILKSDPNKMIMLTDWILAASGTATLMVGLQEKPMVIMYRTTLVTALLAKWLVRGYFGLVNLILEDEVVPERFQWEASDDELYKLLNNWISHPGSQQPVVEKLRLLKSKLGDKGATQRVVEILSGYLT